MSFRTCVISEAEPGVVHVSTDLLHEMLTELGGRRVDPTMGGDFEYIFRDKHVAQQPHPNCMIGRK